MVEMRDKLEQKNRCGLDQKCTVCLYKNLNKKVYHTNKSDSYRTYCNGLYRGNKRGKTSIISRNGQNNRSKGGDCENIENAHGMVVAAMVTGAQFSLEIQEFME